MLEKKGRGYASLDQKCIIRGINHLYDSFIKINYKNGMLLPFFETTKNHRTNF